ncbi:MAG: hypothetical protein ACI4TJ_05770, partial [Candidatus Cryptobacteroides sp.]
MNVIHNLLNWYFSKRTLPYWCILLIDCAIVVISSYFGYYSILGGNVFVSSFWPMTRAILVGLACFVISFRIWHTYSGVVRFSSFVDLERVASASFFSSLTFYVIGMFSNALWPDQTVMLFPSFPTILVLFSLTTLLLWVERVMVKRLYDVVKSDNAKKAAIYGNHEGGLAIAKSLTSKATPYSLHAFIADAPVPRGTYLMGVDSNVDFPQIVIEKGA